MNFLIVAKSVFQTELSDAAELVGKYSSQKKPRQRWRPFCEEAQKKQMINKFLILENILHCYNTSLKYEG